jgi:integrase
MGFPSDEMTGHGFRAMARTMLAERLNVDEAVIEAQLAHAVKDPLGRAYNRTEFLEQRRKMLQTWADYLDKLREAAEIIPIKRKPTRAPAATSNSSTYGQANSSRQDGFNYELLVVSCAIRAAASLSR